MGCMHGMEGMGYIDRLDEMNGTGYIGWMGLDAWIGYMRLMG